MTNSYQHKRHQDFNITLDTGNEVIKADQTELLLGGHISNDFTWKEHIRDNKKSIIKKLSSSINILIQVCKIANFKTRKMVANGIIMSQIIYLIQAWGGCSDYLIAAIQVIQNRAARLVTKLDWYTSMSTLLNQCGWLSVRQLITYHSLLMIFKIKIDKKTYIFIRNYQNNSITIQDSHQIIV